MKILVVDDNVELCILLAEQLSWFGHVLFTAYNGQEACTILDKESIDLIILDMAMPVMDGQAFLDEKRWRDWHGVPVIVITGYEAEPREGSDYMMAVKKPFSTAKLVEAIGTAPVST